MSDCGNTGHSSQRSLPINAERRRPKWEQEWGEHGVQPGVRLQAMSATGMIVRSLHTSHPLLTAVVFTRETTDKLQAAIRRTARWLWASAAVVPSGTLLPRCSRRLDLRLSRDSSLCRSHFHILQLVEDRLASFLLHRSLSQLQPNHHARYCILSTWPNECTQGESFVHLTFHFIGRSAPHAMKKRSLPQTHISDPIRCLCAPGLSPSLPKVTTFSEKRSLGPRPCANLPFAIGSMEHSRISYSRGYHRPRRDH